MHRRKPFLLKCSCSYSIFVCGLAPRCSDVAYNYLIRAKKREFNCGALETHFCLRSRDFQWRNHRPPSHSNLAIIKDPMNARQKQGLWARRRHSSGGEGSIDGTTTSPNKWSPVMHQNHEETNGSHNSAGRRWSTHSDQGIQFQTNVARIPQFPLSPVEHQTQHQRHQSHVQKPPTPPKKVQRSLPCTHLKPTVVTFQNLLQVRLQLIISFKDTGER